MTESRNAALRRVTDLLRAAVISGMFSQMLPSELELQHSYETSRNIIRDALAQLRTEGLIERHQGQGTLVVGRRYRHRVDQMGGFSPTGDSVSRELISCEKVNAPPVVAEILGLPEGSQAVMIDRLTIARGEATGLWTSYLTPELAEVIEHLRPDSTIHAAISQVAKLSVSEVLFSVSTGIASGPVAEALKVAKGAPVIREQRVARLSDGRAAEFAVGWSRGDRMIMETLRHG